MSQAALVILEPHFFPTDKFLPLTEIMFSTENFLFWFTDTTDRSDHNSPETIKVTWSKRGALTAEPSFEAAYGEQRSTPEKIEFYSMLREELGMHVGHPQVISESVCLFALEYFAKGYDHGSTPRLGE